MGPTCSGETHNEHGTLAAPIRGGAGAGLAGTTLAALGFGDIETAYADAIRPFKLARTSETRNTCPYCSVACGIIMYSKGDRTRGEKADIIHIEGDADHPTNRGTLCPKGAALLDFVHSETRVKYPMHRQPGSDKFERVTWDFALDRIARLMRTIAMQTSLRRTTTA